MRGDGFVRTTVKDTCVSRNVHSLHEAIDETTGGLIAGPLKVEEVIEQLETAYDDSKDEQEE